MNVPMVKLNEDHEAVITLSSIKDMDRKKFKMFLDMDNDAFLRCEFEKDKGFILYYMYEDRVPLRQLLSAPMSRHQVLTFLRSLTWAFITARDNGMDTSRIMRILYLPAGEGGYPGGKAFEDILKRTSREYHVQ